MRKKTKDPQVTEAELKKIVLDEAADMATAIHNHINSRPRLYMMGMTVVGYAVEMILANAAKQTGQDFDDMSIRWREFVAKAHEDIKHITSEIDKQPQA